MQSLNLRPSRWQQFKDALLSKHYRIQRFGVWFGALFSAVLLCLGMAYYRYHQEETATAATQALYTDSFTTSKTNVSGNIVGVYSNKDHTKSFLMMKMSDVSSIPLNANKYQFFMQASDIQGRYEPVSGQPAGAFYIFGSTGYMGFYLVNDQGFKPQVLNLVGRINDQIVDSSDGDEEQSGEFKKHDQFLVQYNPAAAGCKPLKVLDKKGAPSISGLYSEIVLNKYETSAKNQLRKDLEQMQTDQNNIKDQVHRLEVYDKVKAPKAPKYIRGDSITADSKGQLTLKTKQVIPGGYDLDWQNRTIEQGFIPQVIKREKMDTSSTGEEVLAHMAEKRKDDSDNDEDGSYDSTDIQASDLHYLNGKRVKIDDDDDDSDGSDTDDSEGSVSQEASLNNDIQNLSQAWSQYINDKQQYQTDDMEELIKLEATYRSINGFSAVNDSKHVLEIY